MFNSTINQMKNKFPSFLLFMLFTNSLYSQQQPKTRLPQQEKISELSKKAGAFIDINAAGYPESAYTPTQLVTDVLISSGSSSCFVPNVSNVQVSPNLPASAVNRSWGYFNKATTNFPFDNGIVISTGYAYKGGNSIQNGTLGDNINTGSDADLVAATNPSGSLQNTSILEFDFVPTTNQISFNYLFASEEYTGGFPCGYSDAFALLIRPVTGGAYTNMAVLPAGAGPVSVTNIHPANEDNGSPLVCGAANDAFFSGYNIANIETNFNGRTIPLTATATVVAGQAYHFKMVIADALDHNYDSAVFLEGGSFNIGVELLDPNGATLPSEINVCDNAPQVLTASVNDPAMIYKWFLNGTAIPGATTNTYTAITPGVYSIEVSVPGNPCPGTASITIHGGTTPVAHNATFLLCSTPTQTNFNLNGAKSLISPSTTAIFRFYEDQTDALAQNNSFINNLSDYNGTDGQILYVVVSDGDFCSKMIELTLNKAATPVAGVSSSRIRICAGESVTLTASGGTSYNWTNFGGTGNTQTVTLHQTTTFSVNAIGDYGCQSTVPAVITIVVIPAISSPLQDVEMCMGDTIELDAGFGENFTYLWNTGATTQKIIADQLGIYTVTIDNGICSQDFKVSVGAAASPYFTQVNYENNTITAEASNPTINNIPRTLEYSIDGQVWQASNIFTNLTNNTNYTLYVRTVGTSCVGTLEFFTLQIANVITPNNDGYNDVIDLRKLAGFKNFSGSVYNRYGNEVFKFSEFNPVWNGTIGGRKLPTATYWYKIGFDYERSKTKFQQNGWIMLKNRE